MKISIEKEDLKRLLPIMILGLIEAMKSEAIDSDEGEVICFNPYIKQYFEEFKSDK